MVAASSSSSSGSGVVDEPYSAEPSTIVVDQAAAGRRRQVELHISVARCASLKFLESTGHPEVKDRVGRTIEDQPSILPPAIGVEDVASLELPRECAGRHPGDDNSVLRRPDLLDPSPDKYTISDPAERFDFKQLGHASLHCRFAIAFQSFGRSKDTRMWALASTTLSASSSSWRYPYWSRAPAPQARSKTGC